MARTPRAPPAGDKQPISTRQKRSDSLRKIKTAAQAEDLKRRYLAGATLREIAEALGIDHETVRKSLLRSKVKMRHRRDYHKKPPSKRAR